MIIQVIPTKLTDFTGLLANKYGIPVAEYANIPLPDKVIKRYVETFKTFRRVCNPGTDFVIHRTLKRFFK